MNIAGALSQIFRRRIPVYLQQDPTECGVACLRSVLAYYGRVVPQTALRRECGADRNGTDAMTLLRVAREHGLRTDFAMRLPVGDLAGIPVPAILHWNLDHFVVLERYSETGVVVIDPSRGRVRLKNEELEQFFTGVALMFSPVSGFERVRARSLVLARYRPALKPLVWLLAFVLGLSILVQPLSLTLPRLTQVVVDEVIGARQQHLALLVMGAALLVGAVHGVFYYLRSEILAFVRLHLDRATSTAFFQHVLHLPLPFFERQTTGDILSRAESNSLLPELLSERLVATILDGLMAVVSLIVVAWISFRVAAALVVVATLRMLISVSFRREQYEITEQLLVASGKTNGTALEFIQNVESLKAAALGDFSFRRWQNRLQERLGISQRLARTRIRSDAMVVGLTSIIQVSLLCLAAPAVGEGRLTVGGLFALLALAGLFSSSLISLGSSWEAVQIAKKHHDRLEDVFEEEAEEPAGHSVASLGPLRGELELRGVSFRYDSQPALRNISLRFVPGEFAGIVGESGSGKSTFVRILLGLYRPNEGRVFVDGEPLDEIDLSSYRRQVGSVFQTARVVNGTVLENIVAGRTGLTLADVRKAAEIAAFDRDVESLPLRYSTIVGEMGRNFSAGQIQRMLIARAVVGNVRMIVLDEATSALDAVTEASVQAALERLAVTRVVVAHRLSTIKNADRIVVLEKGAVVEMGTHNELSRRGGAYSRLVGAQEVQALTHP